MSSNIAIQKMVEGMTQSLLQIPDQVGLLVLNDSGGVISSHGDLSNDEQAATALMNMVKTAWKVHLGDGGKGKKQGNIAKLSVIFEDHLFSATVSNGYVYIVKRQNREPATA